MRMEEYDGSAEREVLTALIVSTMTLDRLSSLKGKQPFRSKHANIVAEWCFGYHERYKRAPSRTVENLFRDWAGTTKDEHAVKLIETLLESLSGEYERLSEEIVPARVIDRATKLFEENRLRSLQEGIGDALSAGKPDKAKELVAQYGRDAIGADAPTGAFLLNDLSNLDALFAKESSDVLIRYPGALGRFFGDQLARDRFVAFMGPEGRGKSWWLIDIAWRALQDHRKVAYFDMGDMWDDLDRRIYSRAAGFPLSSSDGKWPCKVSWPKGIDFSGKEAQAGPCEVREYPEPLNALIARRGVDAFLRTKLKSNRHYFYRDRFPTKTQTVAGIRSVLLRLAAGGFQPDVCIIDYADIIAPPNNRLDARDAINENWTALRSLSLEFHVLLVTATQTNRDSYDSRSISSKHISDDKRKRAHVNALWTINCTPEEEKHQIQRLGTDKIRAGAKTLPQVYVANCLALAHPSVCSAFRKQANLEEDDG